MSLTQKSETSHMMVPECCWVPEVNSRGVTHLCREQWLAAAQKVFQSLDSQSNGLTMERLMCVLREKLPAAEVEYAVEDALVDAGYKGKPIP